MTKKPTTTARPATQGETTPFEQELERNIRAKVAELKRCGTVGMGAGNLRQVTPTPKASEGAPVGTNAQWAYAQIFARALGAMKFTGFSILN